jgi:cell shape-determining protein MreD
VLFALLIYIAWVIELSGLTRTAEGAGMPCLLHVALVLVIWYRTGVSAVAWAAAIGLLLDLAAGTAGVQLMLASTLALAASDWRQSRRCERGLTLGLLAVLVISALLIGAELWKGMSSGELPPAVKLKSSVLFPAASAAFTALLLRWSLQLSRRCVKTAFGREAEPV